MGLLTTPSSKKNAIVMWSNDPMDYRPLPAHQLVNNVIRKAHPGAIVLMHDGGGNHPATVQALPQIITKLTQQGYKFVTIPQLLKMTDPKTVGSNREKRLVFELYSSTLLIPAHELYERRSLYQ
jgi:chitin deacetylase